eukprot:2779236-Karenia_brevis.AAC.1
MMYFEGLHERMQPAMTPAGKPLTCTTCRFNILAGEYSDNRHVECECGGFLCYDCQEKGRPCWCRGG